MDHRRTRLYVQNDLSTDSIISLSKEHTHYLNNVLRKKTGDYIALFNGRDGEFKSRIIQLENKKSEILIEEKLRRQNSEPDLWLLFAPLKLGRIDYLVEKATELGVSEMHPVITERTVVDRINYKRLNAHIIEASEQSERLTVPVLHESKKLKEFLKDWPKDRVLFLCDESGKAKDAYEVLKNIDNKKYAVLIGPEGGFGEAEFSALRALSFIVPINLGSRVMRADTAAIAALSVVQMILGDWKNSREYYL